MSFDTPPPAPGMSDEQLLSLYRGGQRKAFEFLLERYKNELFHFLMRFVGTRAAAEDLFQETFLQVHVSAESFDIERRFRPWLFTIAANKARDHLRRNSKRQTAALSASIDEDGEGRTFADLMEGEVPQPTDEAEANETRELVQQVMAEMPAHLREVLVMAYFHQFAYKQIADMLSIPLGTVKSRLHAAVASFAELWKRKYQPKGPRE
jgi:RNA polymerase sigma-70 factor, ECF subfamily